MPARRPTTSSKPCLAAPRRAPLSTFKRSDKAPPKERALCSVLNVPGDSAMPATRPPTHPSIHPPPIDHLSTLLLSSLAPSPPRPPSTRLQSYCVLTGTGAPALLGRTQTPPHVRSGEDRHSTRSYTSKCDRRQGRRGGAPGEQVLGTGPALG